MVAPCFGPEAQVSVSRCMPHQMPTYLKGLNQDTSPSAFGSLRLRIRSDMYRPAASSAICSVRQGVANGAVRRTRAPSDDGDSVGLQPLAVDRAAATSPA